MVYKLIKQKGQKGCFFFYEIVTTKIINSFRVDIFLDGAIYNTDSWMSASGMDDVAGFEDLG